MKKILSLLISFYFFFSWLNVFAYDIEEWASNVESVINQLEWSDYTFKYNAGSSAKASYHVFFKWNMIWYIYATEDWITLWEWWDTKWELGIFYNQQNLTLDQIIARFYTDKSDLWDSINWMDYNIYECKWESSEFFECLSDYTDKWKNSKWKIYLFDGKVIKDINISNWDKIKYESEDNQWIKETCYIENFDKWLFVSMLWRWWEWAFSVKDLDYAECTKESVNNSNNDLYNQNNATEWSNLNITNDLINLDDIVWLGWNNNIVSWTVLSNWWLNWIIPWLWDLGLWNLDLSWWNNFENLNNTNTQNLLNTWIDLINWTKINNVTNLWNKINYQDGLDIIEDTNSKLKIVDNKLKDNSLRWRMLFYRKLWNNVLSELEKWKKGKEWLRIKYLHKKIEEKYKKLFKEYVLTEWKNKNNKKLIQKINTNTIGFDNNVIIGNNNWKNTLSKNIYNNFKLIFWLLGDKYTKNNFTLTELNRMNSLFNRVDKKWNFLNINDYLKNNSDILKDEYNIELLQKLLIIMCKK